MLADLLLHPSGDVPSHLSGVERDGDGLSALLTAAVGGNPRTYAVRAAPLVVRGEVIGAVELVITPPPRPSSRQATHEAVAPLLRTVRHDIKNELTIVLGYIGLARDSLLDQATSTGLDRAVAAAGEIGRLVEFTRELEELGEQPEEARELAALVRDAADAADLKGIDLEIAVPLLTITADPMVFSVLEHLLERLFQYSAATTPRPNAIRVSAGGTDPLSLVYEDDALSADRTLHPDRAFSRDLDRDLPLLREMLSLDGIGLAVRSEPLRLELRIPGARRRG
jgi:signal transduction histidine kinase